MLIRLRHPYVVPIIGHSLPTPDSLAQIATEYAAHGLLHDALEQRRGGLGLLFRDDTGIPIIMCGVVRGTTFIHSRNTSHRSLKPGNIFLDADGLPRIGDLGSSRVFHLDTTLTR
jgi:serine/threonine protein kinase